MCHFKIVSKRAPGIPVDTPPKGLDVFSLHSHGRELTQAQKNTLKQFLIALRDNNLFIVCMCRNDLAFTSLPAMISVLREGKYFVRNLSSRESHAEGCPFGYQSTSGNTLSVPIQSLASKPLNLFHRAKKDYHDKEVGHHITPYHKKRISPPPKLLRLFVELLESSNAFTIKNGTQYIKGIYQSILDCAHDYKLDKQRSLNRRLYLLNDIEQLKKDVMGDYLKGNTHAHGLLLGLMTPNTQGEWVNKTQGVSFKPRHTHMLGPKMPGRMAITLSTYIVDEQTRELVPSSLAAIHVAVKPKSGINIMGAKTDLGLKLLSSFISYQIYQVKNPREDTKDLIVNVEFPIIDNHFVERIVISTDDELQPVLIYLGSSPSHPEANNVLVYESGSVDFSDLNRFKNRALAKLHNRLGD